MHNNGLYLLAYVYTLTLVLLSVVSQCHLVVTSVLCQSVYTVNFVVNIDSDYL